MGSWTKTTLGIPASDNDIRNYLTPFIGWSAPDEEPGSYTVTCLSGKSTASGGVSQNWSLNGLYETNEALREAYEMRIAAALHGQCTKSAFAPRVSAMSAVILKMNAFTCVHALKFGTVVLRPPESLRSDGIIFGKPDAASVDSFLMAAAGCALIVLTSKTDPGLIIAAHAGANSLIDKKCLMSGIPSREHFSVVGAMVAAAREAGHRPPDLILRSFFEIPWERYPHSEGHAVHGPVNEKMISVFSVQYGPKILPRQGGVHHLDIAELIRAQAVELDVGLVETGKFRLTDDFAMDGSVGGDRNLVVCRRNPTEIRLV